ncbi:TonB-dependent hemoglobin/transferrin/lactoferrin family receptor [Gallibacterium trehalosifermentans]|uniref:TonB-dependent hemoglobin/transferrin/lactoferrin family receptor n=1 Tax=Gallibacterium trehalosifermentans TaxID=516935 RepID=A0ABV6H2N1_9PAST
MKLSKISILLISATLLPAYAADQLEEINVIALRDPTEQAKQQATLTVISKNELNKQQATSVANAISTLANVSISGGSRALAQQPIIRGMGGSRIVQIVDGIRQNFALEHRGSYFVPTSMLAQIEVIKGPASTLWGSGALGGVVATRTVNTFDLLKENEKWGITIRQGYQSANSLSTTSAAIYGITDNIDILIQGIRNKNSDLRLGGKLGDLPYSGLTQQGGLLKFGWQINDAQRLELNARQTVSKQLAPNNNEMFAPYTPRDLYTDIGAAHSPGSTVSPATLYAKLGGTSDLAQQKVVDKSLSIRYLFNPASALINSEFTAYVNHTKESEINQRTHAADSTQYQTYGFNLRNTSEFEKISLIYGIDFYQDHAKTVREKKEYDGDSTIATDLQTAKYRPNSYNAKAKAWGAYLLTHIKLNDQWIFSPAVRFDAYKTSEKHSEESYKGNHISPSATLSFQATEWLTLAAKYSEAFRAPSIQEKYISGYHFGFGGRRVIAATFANNPNLQAEIAKNKELNANLHWNAIFQEKDQLNFSVTLFQNDIQNLIKLETIEKLGPVPSKFQYQNVQNARLRGVELTSNYLAARWSTYLSYGLLKAKDMKTGKTLEDTNEQKIIFGANYDLIRDKFNIGATLSHYFAQKYTNNADPYPSYTLVGLNATYAPKSGEWQNLQVDFGIDNLFDKAYTPAYSLIPEAGRNVKLSVTYKF